MATTLLDLSNSTWQDLGSPSSLAPGVISYWYRTNVGNLNNLLFTEYSVNNNGDDFNPVLGDNEAAIFKVMYMIYYYDTKIRENLGAAAVDSVVEISEGGALVRLVSKNNIALSYIQQKRLANEELNDLVAGYRTGNSIPRQVVGDDTKEGYYNPTSLEERAGT